MWVMHSEDESMARSRGVCHAFVLVGMSGGERLNAWPSSAAQHDASMPPPDEGNYVAKNALRDKTLRDKMGQQGASASGLIQVAPDPQLAPRASMLAPPTAPAPFQLPAPRPFTRLPPCAHSPPASVLGCSHCPLPTAHSPMIIFARTRGKHPLGCHMPDDHLRAR
jgi:hypothetical protein